MDVQQLFKNLKKEAECPLCSETVKEPKTLPCLHSFCLNCLDKHAGHARRRRKEKLKCPVCPTEFNVPKGDTFSDFPTSFHLNRLVDVLAINDSDADMQTCNSCDDSSAVTSYCFVCQSFLCAACFDAHQRLRATRGHRSILFEKLQAQDVEELMHRPAMCTQKYHQNEALEYYCQDCKVCVCVKCGLVNHNGHALVDIEGAAGECRNQITEVVGKAKAQVSVLERRVSRKTEFMNKSIAQMYDAQAKVSEAVDELVRILREHEEAMKTKLRQLVETQQRNHKGQLEVFQSAISQLKNCIEQGEGIVQRNFPVEILQTERSIIGRAKELLNVSEIKIYQLSVVKFVPNTETLNTIKLNGSGQIYASGTDASLSTVNYGNDSRLIFNTGSKIRFQVTTRDLLGDQTYNKDDRVLAEIVKSLGCREKAIIKDLGNGNYEVCCTLKQPGHNKVAIYINEMLVADSSWKVAPSHVAYSIAQCRKTGNIAVADYDNKKVLLYDSMLNYLRTVVDFGPDRRPRCLAFTNFFLASNVIVIYEDTLPQSKFPVFSHLSKISVFTPHGYFVMGIGAEFLTNPCSVSVKNDGQIIVCDSGDRSVKLLSPDGTKLLKSFKAKDADTSPWFAVHDQKKYFVSYRIGQSLKVFNEDGVYLHDIGKFGAPAGLAIDKFSNLIVCDSDAKSVKVFTLNGEFVTSLPAEKYLECPCSVVVFNNGDVLLTDLTTGLIFTFHCESKYQLHEKKYLIS